MLEMMSGKRHLIRFPSAAFRKWVESNTSFKRKKVRKPQEEKACSL